MSIGRAIALVGLSALALFAAIANQHQAAAAIAVFFVGVS